MSNNIDRSLQALGIPTLVRPDFPWPSMTPETLISMPNAEFAGFFTRVGAWSSYTRELQAETGAQLLELRHRMAQTIATVRKELRPQYRHRPTHELDDEVMTEVRVVEASEDERQMSQLQIRIDAICARLEADLRLISRVVELRRQDLDQQRSENGLPMRGFVPRPISASRGGRR
jgi:hypothetical protein